MIWAALGVLVVLGAGLAAVCCWAREDESPRRQRRAAAAEQRARERSARAGGEPDWTADT